MATAAPGGVQPAWTVAPAVSGRLYGVAAISNHNVWAVGLNDTGSLIMHWNGSTWSQSQPNAGYFIGVEASSARDVWAVGGTNWFSPSQPLAEHYNGRSWTQIAVPNPSGGGYFQAVAATSRSNAWAVGLVGPGPGIPSATTPLIEHWNGRHWTIQHFQMPAGGGQFTGVAALSPRNAWAVGWTGGSGQGTGQQTLIEHWNGRTWSRVTTPNAGTASFLRSVTFISSANAWAVGYYNAAGTSRTLALHWNGKHWTRVPSQSPGNDAAFLGVTASRTHGVWSVGIRNPTRCSNGGPKCQTLAEHWNRTSWTLLQSPNPPSGYLNVLFGVSAAPHGDIWAVGTTDYSSTLIVHWNGTS